MTRADEAAGAPARDARPRLRALCAGRAAPLLVRENDDRPRTVVSGIAKQAISTLADPVAVAIGALGVDGDEIVDLTVHGGLDKAVYLYPAEHYAFWNTVRGQAGRRERRREQPVEGAAGLEGAALLKVFQLQVQQLPRPGQRQAGGDAHLSGDSAGGGLDRRRPVGRVHQSPLATAARAVASSRKKRP